MGSKINVLHVVNGLQIGGTEKQTVKLVKSLDKNKYRTTVCCLVEGGPLLEDLKGYKVFILNKKKRFDFSTLLRLCRIIKKEKIDIVHTHNSLPHQYGRTAAILARAPIIISTKHALYNYGASKLKKRDFLISRLLSLFTDRFISLTKYGAVYYNKKEKMPLWKTSIIYNGINPQEYCNANGSLIRKEFGFKKEDIVVGFVGRLAKIKNLHCFLDAARIISKNNQKVKFMVVGSGPLEEKLKDFAKKIGLSNIIFTGTRKDIPNIVSIFDMLALTSHSELCPNAVLEAMAAGKPVVATKVGGVPELVKEGVTGFLAEPNNHYDVAEKISALINNPALREKFGKNGQNMAESFFTQDIFIKLHEKIYDKLARKKLTKTK